MSDDETASYPVCGLRDCPGYGHAHAPIPAPPGHFTAGDVAAVTVLLTFTMAWIFLFHLLVHAPPPEEHPSTADVWADLIVLAVQFVPATWSAGLAGQIIRRRLLGGHA